MRRRRHGAAVFGVCVGFSEATGWPVAIWRGVFMALACAGGLGLLIYITFCFAVPLED
ncbi:PspC domain-containing protein [Escherichia coli]|uniref:PspC domain-containing protein n=1 Tax=Escherichia coli TaxID=562 RepID=UPI0034D4B22B